MKRSRLWYVTWIICRKKEEVRRVVRATHQNREYIIDLIEGFGSRLCFLRALHTPIRVATLYHIHIYAYDTEQRAIIPRWTQQLETLIAKQLDSSYSWRSDCETSVLSTQYSVLSTWCIACACACRPKPTNQPSPDTPHREPGVYYNWI